MAAEEENSLNLTPTFGLNAMAATATIVGGCVIFSNKLLQLTSPTFMALLLSLSGGIILFQVLVVLFAHSFKKFYDAFTDDDSGSNSSKDDVSQDSAWLAATARFVGGILMSYLVDIIVQKLTPGQNMNDTAQGDAAPYGVLSAVAVGIHNVPAGIATFVASSKHAWIGLSLAIGIALHNFVEGIAIATPIYFATGSTCRGLQWCFLPAVAQHIGGLIANYTRLHRRFFFPVSIVPVIVLLLLLLALITDAKDVVTSHSEGKKKVVTMDEMPDEVIKPRKKHTTRNKTFPEPEVESLLADFNHDGRVERREIQQIKDKLHHFLDTDDSGGLDPFELKKRALNDQDVDAALNKLDSDHDAIISWKELDERWESVGAEMTVAEVADWVAYAVQLPQYSDVFRANSISGYTFPLLMANDGARLQEIGVHSELHRHQLAMFLQMKYLGMGRKPEAVVSSVCNADGMTAQNEMLLQLAWVPAENSPQRYQLQRRIAGEMTWELVFTGADTEFMDVVEPGHRVVYRLTTWNSYGRSSHTFVRCDDAVARAATLSASSSTGSALSLLPSLGRSRSSRSPSSPNMPQQGISYTEGEPLTDSADDSDYKLSLWGLVKMYFWWLDDAIVILLVVMLPIRGIIYGDADSLLRLLRRLPPNMPTRVTVEVEPSKTTVENAVARVSWEKPVDNGVPIVCYTVRWTRTKTEEVKWIKLLAVPLPTAVVVDKLCHGETYKFVVQATNKFGLITSSSRSTYMVPIPELKGKLRPRRHPAESRAVRNQCHVCHDPRYKKKMPFTATLDRVQKGRSGFARPKYVIGFTSSAETMPHIMKTLHIMKARSVGELESERQSQCRFSNTAHLGMRGI
ncbi:unnamed protein product [Peronospora belbahrii]|uniref:Calmodulin n=1 Tax=Peronospora belbahrii TaxID=622444 RepID=A0ABN8CU79_9STRA|nr:unnamed protein product [Peronospora belbahrii]